MRIKLRHALIIVFMIAINLPAQDRGINIRLGTGYQLPSEMYRIDQAEGYVTGGRISFDVTEAVDFSIGVNYERMNIGQQDVLDEWDWDYWENTYVRFLPGIDVSEVNRTLHYDNGQRAAAFEPIQSMEELRFSFGVSWHREVLENIRLRIGLDAGFSSFSRNLEMHEHWLRRFDLFNENESGGIDTSQYVYRYDLLHFAPPKKGYRLFFAPLLNTSWRISRYIDLYAEGQAVYYLRRDQVESIEKMLHIPPGSDAYFPVAVKWIVAFGLNFRY
jgi:hypothetical protein